MKFHELPLPGLFAIESERLADERGYFSRLFCRDSFAARGLAADFPQCSLSHNTSSRTLRGLHYQAPPQAEAKIVNCISGRVFDVVVDLRPGSDSFGRWHAEELAAGDDRALYIPAGCAHGFLTLAEHSELHYMISVPHDPDSARGVRWDDPQLAIAWPEAPRVISERDRQLPTLEESGLGA